MARIEQVNVDGTNYDVGKLASTTAPGVVQVGSGLAISSGGVLSATGGGTADAVEWDNVLNKPTFSTVATSGSYNDLTNKPTIPTVNNATLTIQKNGTTVKTFTANASSNVTANITVPTAVSDLSDAGNYVTQTDIADVIRTTDVGVIRGQNIADSEITSSKIDWSTIAPYWKTVATSTSSSVTLPAGYRLYRVRLCGNKTSTSGWGVLTCPQATGTTWIYVQGMSNGAWVAAERSVTASSDKAVMDGARGGTAPGIQTWDITISKQTTTGTACIATWETSTTGSLTFNTGRSIFNVTSGTANLTLNSELSSAFWSVEALVED